MKLLTAFALILLFTLFPLSINAQKDYTQESASSSAVVATDSAVLFWPLSAGKTEGDSFYSLKLLKEQIRGFFLFDLNQKADYAVFLGTKRVLEAEQLLKNDKIDLGQKALDRADLEFSSAYQLIKKAAIEGKFSAEKIRRDRLTNVKKLADSLKSSVPESLHPKLDMVKERADALLRDYLP